MASIDLNSLTKDYGVDVAVNDLDLNVKDGEFIVLVGPSGCGKSTTLRLIAGLESPTEGTVNIDGEIVNGVPPKNRGIAMVFQNYALYPHMNAKRNMTFGMKSAGSFSDEEINQRADEAMDLLGISNLADRKPSNLSGGQRQRVAIGRALVRDPKVFLMDEPLSNLDAKLRIEMRAELSRLHDELETTTVYVTHDQTEAMTLGDRIAILDSGELQQLGTPEQVYNQPNNQFIAEFIGDPAMNIMLIDLSKDQDEVTLSNGSLTVKLHKDGRLEDIVEGKYHLGIRPENIGIRDTKKNDNGDIKGIIDVIEPLGEEYLTHVRIGSDILKVKIAPDKTLNEGDEKRFSIDENAIHLFDMETGNAIYHSSEKIPIDNA